MISSKNFKNSFDKVINNITEKLILESDLHEMCKDCFDITISNRKCENVRTNAIHHFKVCMANEYKKMCESFEVCFHKSLHLLL